jgi:hypothetical protein
MSNAERNSKREIRRSRNGNKFNNNERVQEQAEVTIHIKPSNDLETRSENALSRKKNKDLVYPGGSDLPNHDFEEGDIIWNFRNDFVGSTSGVLKGNSDHGWVDLNGLDVTPFGTSQRLQNSIYPTSISKSQYSPLSLTEGSAATGVAGATYGSRSITNVVVEQAYTGDRLIAFCPNVSNPNELESFSHGGLGLTSTKKNKITPVLKPFDIKDVKYNEIILALKALELNRKLPKKHPLTIMDETNRFTPEEEASAEFQHLIMSIVLIGYTVLSNRGILQLNLKPKVTGQGFEFDTELAGNGSLDTADLLNGQTASTTTNYSDIKFHNDSNVRYGTNMDDDSFFARREEEEVWMANLLGVLDGPYLQASDTTEIRNDILKMVIAGHNEDSLYYPLMGGILESEDGFDVETLFDIDDLQNKLHHMVKNMMDIPHNLHQGAAYLNKVTAGKIIGTSIGSALPGDQVLDELVNGTSFIYK